MTRITTCLAVSALTFSLGTAMAQSGGLTSPTTPSGTSARTAPVTKAKIARADRKFIEEAAASGMFEVQAAQLAVTKASDKTVRDYASTLVDHHGAANSELTQLANRLGLELASTSPRAMRNEIERLGKRTGTEFDQEFVRNVGVKEHEKDIKAFQKAAKDVKDPQLKAWIDKTLPVLQQHLAAAQNMVQAGDKAADATKSGSRTMGGPANPSGTNKSGN